MWIVGLVLFYTSIDEFNCALWKFAIRWGRDHQIKEFASYDMGASMVKWTKIMLQYTKTIVVLVKGMKVEAKCCWDWFFFSWWPLLLCKILKCRISNWELKNFSSKVILKSKWLNLIIDVDFMTLRILKLEFLSYNLNSLYTWGHLHKDLWKTNHFLVFYGILNKF